MSINIVKNSPILICGMNNNLRTLIARTLQGQGYTMVTTSAELKLGVQRLETENFDWLIIDLRWKDPVNAINFLKLINETPSLAHMKVSLMVTPDEMAYVSKAFELGILSFHNPIGTEIEMKESFQLLADLREKYSDDSRLVSSYYLKKFLKEQGYYRDLVNYFSKLAELYPNNVEVLKQLAEAHLLIEENDDAHSILLQLCNIDPLLTSDMQPFIEMATLGYSKEMIDELVPYPFYKRGLIITPDRKESSSLKNHLESLQIEARDYIFSGELEDQLNNIDIIFIDWQQEDAPCPTFVERILETETEAPIIGIFPEGTHLPENFSEYMGFTATVIKPCILSSISKALTQVTMTRGSCMYLRIKMIQAALKSKMQSAQILKSEYFNRSKLPEGKRNLMEAWISLQNNEFMRAKECALKAMNVPTNTNQALLLLSKALVSDKDYKSAVVCYKKIKLPSSYKLGLIFDLAAEKLHKKVKNRTLDMHPPLKYGIGLSSAKGTAYINQGILDEGIGIFLEALNALKISRPELTSIVCYNLGLALARSQLLVEAQDAFRKAKETKSRARISRCVGMLKTLKSCLTNNTEYKGEHIPDRPLLRDLESLIATSFKRDETDTCCQDLYVNTQNPLPTDFLFKKVLDFKRREVIHREANIAS